MIDENEIQKIINSYDKSVKEIDKKATNSQSGRAYGGIVRAEKGTLVENIAKTLVNLAWKDLGQDPQKLKFVGSRVHIPIKQEYIDNIKDDDIKKHILKNIKDYVYPCKSDVLIAIDDKPVFEIECKAYTENAMMKRILVDCTLLKRKYPDMKFALIQLESQLGGDYSELKDKPFGSNSTHTLLSMFDVDLKIITLLKGERLVNKAIHDKGYFKSLTKDSLKRGIEELKLILKECI